MENSVFSGWASITNFEQRLFIPNLDDKLDLVETIKPTFESCSVVYRGKLYVYGQGLTNFYVLFYQYNLLDISLSLIFVVLTHQDKFLP